MIDIAILSIIGDKGQVRVTTYDLMVQGSRFTILLYTLYLLTVTRDRFVSPALLGSPDGENQLALILS